MKRHTVIIILKALQNETEIAHFIKVGQSFIVKIQKELKATDEDPTSVAKCKTHAQGSNAIKRYKLE